MGSLRSPQRGPAFLRLRRCRPRVNVSRLKSV
nr:MAG TPA: hypothetical protein [Caudoviricetes sp.]